MENNNTIQSSNPMDEINSILNGYTERPTVNPEIQPKGKRGRKPKSEATATPLESNPNEIPENPIISGSLLVLMIDLLIPNLIAMANNKFSKKKIKASKLQMTSQQRNELEPIAEQVAKEMSLKASPMSVLIISLLGIYGVKFMELKNE